mgnify:CR=1 FL=1
MDLWLPYLLRFNISNFVFCSHSGVQELQLTSEFSGTNSGTLKSGIRTQPAGEEPGGCGTSPSQKPNSGNEIRVTNTCSEIYFVNTKMCFIFSVLFR